MKDIEKHLTDYNRIFKDKLESRYVKDRDSTAYAKRAVFVKKMRELKFGFKEISEVLNIAISTAYGMSEKVVDKKIIAELEKVYKFKLKTSISLFDTLFFKIEDQLTNGGILSSLNHENQIDKVVLSAEKMRENSDAEHVGLVLYDILNLCLMKKLNPLECLEIAVNFKKI